MHTEWIAATTGFEADSTRLIRLSRLGSRAPWRAELLDVRAARERLAGAGDGRSALTAPSSSARSTPSATALRVSNPRPLTGGLSRVMTATAPRTS
jgi:hypothetical protein